MEIQNSNRCVKKRYYREHSIKANHNVYGELAHTEILRRMRVNAKLKDIVEIFRVQGYLHPLKHKAVGNSKLQLLRDEEIVKRYNFIITSILG